MITKNSTLKQILNQANAKEILAKHNVPCLGCPMAKLEMDKLTIGQICNTYRINLENLLKDLNKT